MKMKRKISIFLTAALIFCCGATAFSYAEDIEADYSMWDSTGIYPSDVMGTKLLTPVKFLMDRKIITGDSDGLFHPDKNITRAEFATIMAKATNNANAMDLNSLSNEDIFSDLAGYGWAKPYINGVAKAGLFKGRSADMFAPGESVTYAEVITVLIRMSQGAADTAEGMASKWPDNYIAYAETYNFTGDVVIYDWNSPATKGDVARLLYRRMPKD